MSREPSYYEIALTQRQVVIAFMTLLACLVAAFFSGVWVGTGGREPEAGAQVAARDGGIDAGVDAGIETAGADAAPGEPPTATGEDRGADSLRFFSEEDGGAEPPPTRTRPSRTPSSGTAPPPEPPSQAASGTVTGNEEGSGEEGSGNVNGSAGGTGNRKVHADPDDPRRRSNVATPVRPLPQAPQPVDPRDTEPPGAGGPVIQVFSSHDQAQAQAVLDRLLVADLDAYLSPADVRGVIHYRVRLGPFRDQEQAEAVARQLRQDFQLETWITR